MPNFKRFANNIKSFYPGMQEASEGVCYGFSMMYIQAVLCGEIDPFMQRLELLLRQVEGFTYRPWKVGRFECSSLEDAVEDAQSILKNPSSSPQYKQEAEEYIDAWAFIDSVLSYHGIHVKTLNYGQNKLQLTSSFLLPAKLQEKSPFLHKLYEDIIPVEPSNFNQKIEHIITGIKTKLAVDKQDRAALLLIANDHAIAISWNASGYQLFDQNKQEFISSNLSITQLVAEISNLISITALTAMQYLQAEQKHSSPEGFSLHPIIVTYFQSRQRLMQPSAQPRNSIYPEELLASYDLATLPTPFSIGQAKYLNDKLTLEQQLELIDSIVSLAIYLQQTRALQYQDFFQKMEAYYFLTLHDPKFHGWTTQNINKPNTKGLTLLHMASLQGQTSLVSLLLKVPGINVNARTYENDTPLDLACINKNIGIAKLLLNSNKAIQGNALYWACLFGNIQIVQLLLADNGIQISQRDIDAATRKNQLEILKLLFNKKRQQDSNPFATFRQRVSKFTDGLGGKK
jgi:Ankyrin repeats (3 copies)